MDLKENSMNHIIINQEKCIGCGLCVRDCPSSYLYLKKKKAVTHDMGCIE